MKVSVDWVKEYVSIGMDFKKLINALTMVGLEVESVIDRFDYLKDVYVGQIVEVKKHPNASKLKLCIVDCVEKVITVVCGADNVVAGMFVPVGLPGMLLLNDSVLKKVKIRGEVSEGMLCSEVDLGLGLNSQSIMSFDKTIAMIGKTLKDVLLLSDYVLEINLTPNRPDCSGVIGVAREIAAIQDVVMKKPSINIGQTFGNIHDFVSVSVNTPTHCLRYVSKMLDYVNVGPSPLWIKNRLASIGLKSINNVVDIANFVMFETGQPLHVFDFDRLSGSKVVVKDVKNNEDFVALDGKSYILDTGMISVCDADKPVAIGGVIGGYESRVSCETKKIFIESAHFDPRSIAKTSRKLGIVTDSSYRFERGVDPDTVMWALDRVVSLMVEFGVGRLIGGIIDKNFESKESKTSINLCVDKVNKVLGLNLDLNKVISLLTSVEFNVKILNENDLIVFVPSFRLDIECSEDLIGEIARLYGYDNIPVTFSVISVKNCFLSEVREKRNKIRSVLNGFGFSEVISYSFIDDNAYNLLKFSDDYRQKQIKIINPMSIDRSVMRTSLVHGLLDTVRYNIDRREKNLKIFEIGKVFLSCNDLSFHSEVEMLTGLWTGVRIKSSWCTKEEVCDFFDLKGVVEQLFMFFGKIDITFTKMPDDLCCYTRKGYSAQILFLNKIIGLVGEVDCDVLKNYGIKQPVFLFDIDFDFFSQNVSNFDKMRSISRFPSVCRDATLIINKRIEFNSLLLKIKELGDVLLNEFYLLDVFYGNNIPDGMKSVSFRMVYRSFECNLDDKIVNKLHKSLIDKLVKNFDALLPS